MYFNLLKDWTSVFARFQGSRVALGDDETPVIASGQTAKEVLQRAREEGHSHPILTRLPESLDTSIGRA